MARDVLAIQAAGVGIEREFSIASAFNHDNRSYSGPVLGALMVCNHAQSEDIHAAKQEYFLRIRMEEIDSNDLEAEIQLDAEDRLRVIQGLADNFISDNEEESDEANSDNGTSSGDSDHEIEENAIGVIRDDTTTEPARKRQRRPLAEPRVRKARRVQKKG
jgi:hypothetical protein